MKDIVIKANDIRREAYVFLACFVMAFIINIVAITTFDRPWSELYSQIGYVFFITLGIYFILAIIRIVLFIVLRTLRKTNK